MNLAEAQEIVKGLAIVFGGIALLAGVAYFTWELIDELTKKE